MLFAPPRAYTPVFSANITIGNGTIQGEWSQVGDVVHWWVRFVLGSTSVVGGLPIVSLPKPPAHGLASSIGTTSVGTLLLRDASAAGAASRRAMTVLSDYTSDPQTAWGINPNDGTGVTASNPWSWAAGDSMDYSGSYKTAS